MDNTGEGVPARPASEPLGSRVGWAMVIALWLAAVLGGLAALARYSNTAGTAAAAPAEWPAESRMARNATGATLVMIAHPRCTCTRASLSELAEILARSRHKPRAYVVFVRPGQLPDGWESGELWSRAARIPGTIVVRDETGAEAAAFGAATSGQIFLYDSSGRLQFSGGTTPSRGHAGENLGRSAILALLNDEPAADAGAPVFGCSLFGAADDPMPHAHLSDVHQH